MRILAIGHQIGALDCVVEEVKLLGGFTLATYCVVKCGHHLIAKAFVLLREVFCLLVGFINRCNDRVGLLSGNNKRYYPTSHEKDLSHSFHSNQYLKN